MRTYEIDGVVPVVAEGAFVHPDAVLVGDVVIGTGCYVGPLASLRGDFGRIELKPGSNIQDGCVAHCFPGAETVVEVNGHVGHGAVLHGCRIGRDALVGMNSVIMDGAAVGEGAFVAANSFVKAGFEVAQRTLVAGSPAKVVRELTDDEIRWKANGTAVYQDLALRSLRGLRAATPLTADTADRKTFRDQPVASHVPLRQYRDGDPSDDRSPGSTGPGRSE